MSAFTAFREFEVTTEENPILSYTAGFLDSKYNEPHRKYHNFKHVETVISKYFDLVDVKTIQVENAAEMEAAITFHDIEYVVGAIDNEARSCETFRRFVNTVGAVHNGVTINVDLVCQLIMATDPRLPKGTFTESEKIIHDLDIHTMGLDSKTFKKVTKLIREEYLTVFSEQEFDTGRVKFLKEFISRPRIFLTDHFYQNYEQIAHQNLQNELNSCLRRLKVAATV